MKNPNTAFRIEFLIVVVLCSIGAVLSAHFVLHQSVPLSFWIMLTFISTATFVIHKILTKANKNKRPQVFVTYFMGTLTAKLLLSAMFLLVVGLADKPNLKFTAVGFLVVYTLLTTLELKNLLPLVRNSNR